VATALEVLAEEASACTKCKLATAGRSKVVFGMGDPDADLMFVGEGPGAEEDKQGLPFVGRSGQLLDKVLFEEFGWTRDKVFIQPKVIVTLGNFATKLLLDTKEGITKLRGRTYPFRTGVLIPTFHPAAVLRGGGEPLAQMRSDFIRAKQALAAA
jgi:DNA polymerase